ncbi:hypothetical protein GCM10010393_33440 [Streptomyces gobitricini]|uniref:Uncharacterized protein n=1 Tax=Streptomyces gobitricini TaxID=68211 RepID=A0ABN3MA64_9ACTN
MPRAAAAALARTQFPTAGRLFHCPGPVPEWQVGRIAYGLRPVMARQRRPPAIHGWSAFAGGAGGRPLASPAAVTSGARSAGRAPAGPGGGCPPLPGREGGERPREGGAAAGSRGGRGLWGLLVGRWGWGMRGRQGP